jgi:hypothetical protein
MSSRRTRILIPTTLAVVVLCPIPAVAAASSLLSGYGGPGQGNQAILGSALLNGPSNRGGGGSAGGGGSTGAGGSSGAQSGTSGGVQEARSNGAVSRASRPSGRSAKGKAGHPQAAVSRAYPNGPLSMTRESGGSAMLGLSGKDVIYIILALGALVLTAALTRQLTRGHGGRGGAGAKGMRSGTRGTE